MAILVEPKLLAISGHHDLTPRMKRDCGVTSYG